MPPAAPTRSRRRRSTRATAACCKDGLVEAYWGDETQGGRRKYYRITDAGRAVFRDNVATWVVTRGIIDSLLDRHHRARTHERHPA